MKSLLKKTEEILSKKKKINQKDETKFNNTKDNFFCCPRCKERILIALNPSNFSLSYNCENNHKETNIDYCNFYQNRYINGHTNKYCQQCKKEKLSNNKTINCNICKMKLCGTCIVQHQKMYNHKNFGLTYNSIKKCPIHDLDISQFCKTCKKNLCTFCLKKNEENEHLNHDVVNFSDLIPGEEDIKNNEKKLKERIIKNNSIIVKLNKWKDEICSLIDETIDKLNKDKLINQMIIQNFNWKYLDYINYKNYELAIEKLEITNEGLEDFYKSKMFIEQTNAITDYLFGKNHRLSEIDDKNKENKKDEEDKNNNIIEEDKNNNIINEKDEKNENKINKEKIYENEIRNEIQFNIIKEINNDNDENMENNIKEALKNEKALLLNSDSIYSFSLENKKINKIIENNKDKNKNKKSLNTNIYESLNALKNNLSDKLGNYNILIWKLEEDLKKDKLINIIKNEKEKNKFKDIQISDNNNFNFLKKPKENINNNEQNERRGSSDNLLFSENNSLFSSNINNNNNNGMFNNYINNEMSKLFTNYNSSNINSNINSNNGMERIREEEYVYISRTGSKYHGRPTCGRMKSSSKVTLSKAESMGLTPCMKCY